jgi:hypothetical protein
MTLKDIRQKVAEFSGRFDLVVPETYEDRGMNFFINSAQRYIERKVTTAENNAAIYKALPANTFAIDLGHSPRVLHNIFINNTESRWELTRISPTTLKNIYGKANQVTTGSPSVYCLADVRGINTDEKDDLGIFLNNIRDDAEAKGTKIVILPTTNRDCIIEASGIFSHVELSNDEDANYWTTYHSMLLINATILQMQISTTGQSVESKHQKFVSDTLYDMECDMIAQDTKDFHKIEG